MGLLDLLGYYFLIVICRFSIEMQYLTKNNDDWQYQLEFYLVNT